jgi:hypothetical protein
LNPPLLLQVTIYGDKAETFQGDRSTMIEFQCEECGTPLLLAENQYEAASKLAQRQSRRLILLCPVCV